VQEFLGKISTNGSLAKIDPARGSFRAWLLTGFQNHLADRSKHDNRLKRGNRMPHIRLDLRQAEENYQSEMTTIDTAGRAFDRAWALALMDEAMRRLEQYYREAGNERLIARLLPALEESLPDGGYREAAHELGMTEAAVRQAVFRMRSRYRLCLLEVAGLWLDIRCDIQLQAKLKELLE
jgi:RNA polymerase sigma-70 factor (ECF subfamily)